MSATTTVLGVTYAGKPMFRSLALDLWIYEQRGEREKAEALLAAHNQIRKAFGQPPVDLAQQFTSSPSSMATQCPSALGALERQEGFEPGERPINRIVKQTMGAMA